MSLPEGFSPFEHLQQTLRKEHNALVQRWFHDLGAEDWKPDVSIPRGSLRYACTMQDIDSGSMTLMRLRLFYDVLGYGSSRLGVFYGIPQEEFQARVSGVPQVFFYFSQDSESVPSGEPRSDAEYSFRLVGETSASMTQSKAHNLAIKVKEKFIVGNKGITFTKGKNIYSYRDEPHGFRFKIYGNSETDIVTLIEKFIFVAGKEYDTHKLNISTPNKKSENKSTKKALVYGKQRNVKRYRPTANVRFRYAYMYVNGLEHPIYLADTTGHHYDALVK